MDGIHLLGEWYGCPADTPEFTRSEALRRMPCGNPRRRAHDRRRSIPPVRAARRHGTVLLAESHPRFIRGRAGFAHCHVYVCNLATDNSEKAKRLFSALEAVLKPARTKYQVIHRGSVDG
jgi:hypothetical protein